MMDRTSAVTELVGAFQAAIRLTDSEAVRDAVTQRRDEALFAVGVTPSEIAEALDHVH